MMKTLQDNIQTHSKELRLPAIRNNYQMLAEQAPGQDADYHEFLSKLLEMEIEERIKNRKQVRIRAAEFPYKKYLDELLLDSLSCDAKTKLPILKSLSFVSEGQNVVLAGNPGTGKTHLAIGLGIHACLQDYKVLFTTTPRLLTRIKEARSERTLRSLEMKFEKYDLVICDEFGYISFDKEGAELLFAHLSLRTGRKSTIITTNLSFDRWKEIFQDPVLTAAMVDRITHKAHFVDMTGDSYRAKETIEMIQKQNGKQVPDQTKP